MNITELFLNKPEFEYSNAVMVIAFIILTIGAAASFLFTKYLRKFGIIVQAFFIFASVYFIFAGFQYENDLKKTQNWEQKVSSVIKKQKRINTEIKTIYFYKNQNKGVWMLDADVTYKENGKQKEYKGPVKLNIERKTKSDVFSFIPINKKLSENFPSGIYLPSVTTNYLPGVNSGGIKHDNENAFLMEKSDSVFTIQAYVLFIMLTVWNFALMMINIFHFINVQEGQRDRYNERLAEETKTGSLEEEIRKLKGKQEKQIRKIRY